MTGLVITATCWLALCSIPLIWTDIKTRRLPNKFTATAYTGSLILLAAAAVVGNRWDRLLSALLSGIALAAFYLVLAVMLPRGMGLGDVKLATSTGTLLGWFSWMAVFAAAFAAFLLASLYGIGLMFTARAHPAQRIPFAPFMIVGALAVCVARLSIS